MSGVIKLVSANEREEIEKKAQADARLIAMRDEMLEVLDGLRGRVESFEMKGLILYGVSDIGDNDFTFRSTYLVEHPLETIGSIEMMKAFFQRMEMSKWESAEDD